MRYIKFSGNAGYCGTDLEQYEAFEDSTTNEALDEYAGDLAHEHGDGYEYLATQGIDEDDFDSEEDYEYALEEAQDNYWADVYCTWTEVSEEEYLENKED